MNWQEYRIEIRPAAVKGLERLAKKLGRNHFAKLREAIQELSTDPYGKTQELYGGLSDFRSLHWSRCRVVVKISDTTVCVYVVAAGWHTSGDRDDVYQQVLRALEDGDVGITEPDEEGTGD